MRGARSARMPAPAAREPGNGGLARGADRPRAFRPSREASLHRNLQTIRRQRGDGGTGAQDNRDVRTQAGTRLRRRRAHLRGARRLHYKIGSDYIVTLNRDAVPRLRIAGYYQRVMNDSNSAPETREYLQERLRSAKWLVKSIYQRQQTIFKVANSIVKFQRAFFDHGISQLKPLVLKDVAEDIGMHESTISRATANKYAHTPQGMFELKFFFTSGVKAATGEDVSAETVKEQIRALVAAEEPGNPLSDQAIAEMLRAKQINIARRTVAKYRQALGILPSANRKQVG